MQAVVEVGSVRDIAASLGISQATAKTHLHNIFRKTGGAIRRAVLRYSAARAFSGAHAGSGCVSAAARLTFALPPLSQCDSRSR
jgi:Bacterial regulatory proteins, luxR family